MTRAVQRAIDLLAVLRTAPGPMSLSELAIATSLDNATALRLLRDLVSRDLVSYNRERRSYVLGRGVLELAGGLRNEQSLIRATLPILEGLHRRTGGRVALSFRVGLHHVVGVELQQKYPVSLFHGVGVSAPLNAGAVGKAILAFSLPEVLDELCARPLARVAPNTIVDPDVLRTEVAEVAERGFALSEHEVSDAVAVAAPLMSEDGYADGAVRVALDGGALSDVEGEAQLLTSAAQLLSELRTTHENVQPDALMATLERRSEQ
ncbi:IclR family transcriptional regulator [Nocardioides sp. GXZ039]|uniref:IclR family transcriptional regulator n=1 Tax=Nocardioides sp. GXZ039 TaxID=3136018 RepID=UPI0030F42F8A